MFIAPSIRHKLQIDLGDTEAAMTKTSNRLTFMLLAGSALAAIPASAGQLYGTEIVQQATIRFYDRYGANYSGWQMLAPLAYVGTYELSPTFDIDLHAKTAYVAAHTNFFGSDFNYSGLTDSVVGATVTATGYSGWQPFVTLDLNVPTGDPSLTFEQSATLADPDLVDLARYGEGFNANISGGVNVFLNPAWTLTAAAGFNSRGTYEPFEGSPNEFDPGDQFTAILRAQYLTETHFGSLQLRYRSETTSQFDGTDYVEPGNRWELKGEGAMQLDALSTLSVLASASWWGKNSYYDFFTDTAVEEATNSNGAIYYGEIKYQRDLGAVDLRAFASIKRRTSNDYDTLDFRFLPKRTIWRIGASIDYALSETTALTVGATGGQLIFGADSFVGETTFLNWSLTAGISTSF
jgi:hypothetical protein